MDLRPRCPTKQSFASALDCVFEKPHPLILESVSFRKLSSLFQKRSKNMKREVLEFPRTRVKGQQAEEQSLSRESPTGHTNQYENTPVEVVSIDILDRLADLRSDLHRIEKAIMDVARLAAAQPAEDMRKARKSVLRRRANGSTAKENNSP